MLALAPRIVVFTGLVGLAGGLVTLALGSSCDVECLPDDRPSVVLSFYAQDGSAARPQPASAVSFVFRGIDEDGDAIEDALAAAPIVHEGICMDPSCMRWAVGTDEAGVFEITAEVCGKTVEREVVVPLTSDGCHPVVRHVDITVDCTEGDGELPAAAREPTTCNPMAVPSAFVYVGILADDYIDAVPVDRVWYEHEGRVGEAWCAVPHDEDAGCATWIAGRELAGPMTIFTEWCDTTASIDVTIGTTDDGCHVETEFVWLQPSSRGCLTDRLEPPDEPPPTGPDAMTSEPPTTPAAPTDVDDLRRNPGHGDPPGPRLGYG